MRAMLLSAAGGLMLAAGAAPALAGGYWDAGGGPLPPPPAYRGDCGRGCPPPLPPPCHCRPRYIGEGENWGPPAPPPAAVGVLDVEGGVGPAFFDSGEGGGEVIIENAGGFGGFGGGINLADFARARSSAFARSTASAHASAFASVHTSTYVNAQIHVSHMSYRQPVYHRSGCGCRK
jgi:hypothetical protein